MNLFRGAEQVSHSEIFMSQGGIHGIKIWKRKKKKKKYLQLLPKEGLFQMSYLI